MLLVRSSLIDSVEIVTMNIFIYFKLKT